MKKLLTVFAVLAMASVANATLLISVDGSTDHPESSITLNVGDTAVIDIHAQSQNLAQGGWMIIQGNGTLDASNPTDLWSISTISNMPEAQLDPLRPGLAAFGYPGVTELVQMEIKHEDPSQSPPDGLVANNVIFTCTVENLDAVITLLDSGTFAVMDSVVIHQIPEPITFALLGLGGLFLRRRK